LKKIAAAKAVDQPKIQKNDAAPINKNRRRVSREKFFEMLAYWRG